MENKTTKHPESEYLYATLQMAVSDVELKEFLKQNRTDLDLLRQVYLCIADEVPLEIILTATKMEVPQSFLTKVRLKHVENKIYGVYSDELEEIRVLTKSISKDVKDIHHDVREVVPTLQELFTGPAPKGGYALEGILSPENMKQSEETANPELRSANNSATPVQSKGSDAPGFWRRFTRNFIKGTPSQMVITMYADGYSDQQINYFLGCVESGMDAKKLYRLMDPKMPIEIMERMIQLNIENLKL